MKALLRIRSDVKEFPGGDYVVLLKTKQALEQVGISCVISPGLDPIPDGIDLVHLFNTTRIHETYLQFKEAKQRGLAVVVTPIWHSTREMKRFYAKLYSLPIFPIWSYLAAKEFYYAKRSHLKPYWPATLQFKKLLREVIEGCDAVLPQSQAELDILRQESGAKPRASYVIPPAFDRFSVTPGSNGDRRDLLCVGRIEPRKNQLAIIKAFKSLGRGRDKLIFYGSMNSSHASYVREVQEQLEEGWVEFRGQVSLETIYAAHARAKAVILASYFETCGFAAMEAMSCGAHACICDSPYTRAFYGESATYCDPFSEHSIAAAIKKVLSKPDADYTDLLRNYSWDQTATKTAEAYQLALK